MNEKTMSQQPHNLRIIIFSLIVLILYHPARGYASYFLFYDPQWSFSSSTEALHRLQPFCDFLSKVMNKEFHPLFLKKKDSLHEYLDNPEVIIALLNTHFVLEHHQTYSLIPLVVPVKQGMSTHQKVLLVMKDSLIKDFSHLKGKSLSLVPTDRDNLDKQLSVVVKQDISHSFEFFHPIIDAVNSESALLALVSGVSDSALTTLESFAALNITVKEHIRVLHLSPPIMNSPLVIIKGKMTDKEIENLRTALLSLHKNDSGKEILNPSGIDSFVSTDLESLNAIFSPPHKKEEMISHVQHEEEIEPEKETSEGVQQKEKVHEEEVEQDKEIVYEIQKGDSLWKIAEQFFGSGEKYLLILKYNEIDNPDIIHFGEKIVIPPLNGCKNVNGENCHEKRN